jgi:hypothetical protein
LKGKLTRLLIVAALAIGAFPIVATFTAPTTNAACTYYITLYENENHGGDSRTFCWADGVVVGIGDLNTVTHTQAGVCNSAALGRLGDDWDDCISSVGIKLPSNRCIVFFNDDYGAGPVTKSRDGTGSLFYSNFSQAGVDKTTSFYFGANESNNCKIMAGPKAGNRYTTPSDQ